MEINKYGEMTNPTVQDMTCSMLYNTLIDIFDKEQFDKVMEVLDCSQFATFVRKVEEVAE